MAKRTKADDPGSTAAATGLEDDAYDESQSDPTSSGAGSGSGGVVDSAKQAASQAASQAKDAASHVLDQAKDQAASRADEKRETVASGFQAVAHAFQSMGDDLRKREEGPVAQYAAEIGQAIGGQVERLANYLRERDVRHLLSDAEEFARRSPAVFLGSAFVLGLAASRFLKSRPAPDLFANMPDPNRALPPASTPGPQTTRSQARPDPLSTPPFWETEGETSPQGARRSPKKPPSVSRASAGASGSQGSSQSDADIESSGQ